ncbi:MAG: hypothetical protein IKM48_01950 [Clostridia bacterium]|nr:hypothetical protein [Clostridia bacterium]
MEEQIENLRITDLLKRELGAPFLFLSGETCMALCVYEHDSLSTKPQPLLHTMKLIHNEIDF